MNIPFFPSLFLVTRRGYPPFSHSTDLTAHTCIDRAIYHRIACAYILHPFPRWLGTSFVSRMATAHAHGLMQFRQNTWRVPPWSKIQTSPGEDHHMTRRIISLRPRKSQTKRCPCFKFLGEICHVQSTDSSIGRNEQRTTSTTFHFALITHCPHDISVGVGYSVYKLAVVVQKAPQSFTWPVPNRPLR
jgi:hypothetical protein